MFRRVAGIIFTAIVLIIAVPLSAQAATTTTSPYQGWYWDSLTGPSNGVSVGGTSSSQLVVETTGFTVPSDKGLWVTYTCAGSNDAVAQSGSGFIAQPNTVYAAGTNIGTITTAISCNVNTSVVTAKVGYGPPVCCGGIAYNNVTALITIRATRSGPLPPPPVDAAKCDGGRIDNVQASLINGKDLVSWRWTGDPTTPMAVQWLNSAGTVIQTNLKGVPYGPWTIGSDSYWTNHANKLPTSTDAVPTTAVTVRVGPWTGTSLSCAATGTVGTDSVIVVGPVSSGSTTPAEGDGATENGCGFSVNPVKWMKCLFLPSSGALQGWSTHIDSVKTHPPVSLMTGGYTYVNNFISAARCGDSSSGGENPGSTCGNHASINTGGTYPTVFDAYGLTGSHGAIFDPLGGANAAAGTTGGQVVRTFMVVGLWGMFGFWAWHRIAASFGGRK